MSLLLITLLSLVCTALQSLLPDWGLAGSLDWPILTGLLMVIVLHADRGAVIYAGVLAGLLYDVFSPAPLGISIPFFLLLGIGLHALKSEVFSDQPITYCVLGMLAVSLKTLYFFVIFSVSGLRPVHLSTLALRLAGGLLLGALTAPAVYLAVSLLLHKSGRKRRRT